MQIIKHQRYEKKIFKKNNMSTVSLAPFPQFRSRTQCRECASGIVGRGLDYSKSVYGEPVSVSDEKVQTNEDRVYF